MQKDPPENRPGSGQRLSPFLPGTPASAPKAAGAGKGAKHGGSLTGGLPHPLFFKERFGIYKIALIVK